MSEVTFRTATDADLPALAAIYIDAVDTLGPRAYTVGQIAAWRRWPIDEPDEFRRRLMAGHCRLAEVGAAPVAFAEFSPPDHLDFLYTSGEFSGRGLATTLHQQLEAIAVQSGAALLRTEASYLSLSVFKRLGYEVVEIEDVVRFGETFRRFNMRKILRPGPPATSVTTACRKDHKRSFESVPRVAAEETVTWQEDDAKNPGWFKDCSTEGTKGYFPRAWFSVDENSRQAVALRDYDASELSVSGGDLVGIIEIESGWVRVMSADRQVGWIPTACAPA